MIFNLVFDNIISISIVVVCSFDLFIVPFVYPVSCFG